MRKHIAKETDVILILIQLHISFRGIDWSNAVVWYFSERARFLVVSYPSRWSFSFILGPLHWSSIFLTSREQRNIVQLCTRAIYAAPIRNVSFNFCLVLSMSIVCVEGCKEDFCGLSSQNQLRKPTPEFPVFFRCGACGLTSLSTKYTQKLTSSHPTLLNSGHSTYTVLRIMMQILLFFKAIFDQPSTS